MLAGLPSTHWHTHSFTGLRAYFFGIPAYNEDQLRHPASWSEELLNSWDFHSQLAVIELAVSHLNKSHMYVCIYKHINIHIHTYMGLYNCCFI